MGKNGLAPYTSIPGYVKGKEKEKLLKESHIFLFPPEGHEGCPVSIMEAMGAGQAVVSTPRGAIPAVVDEGESGFIRDSEDPYVFYEVVKKLLDDLELLSRMQKAAQKKAEQNYEASVVTRQLENIYLQVIQEAGQDKRK